jgi:hypothetical protein
MRLPRIQHLEVPPSVIFKAGLGRDSEPSLMAGADGIDLRGGCIIVQTPGVRTTAVRFLVTRGEELHRVA